MSISFRLKDNMLSSSSESVSESGCDEEASHCSHPRALKPVVCMGWQPESLGKHFSFTAMAYLWMSKNTYSFHSFLKSWEWPVQFFPSTQLFRILCMMSWRAFIQFLEKTTYMLSSILVCIYRRISSSIYMSLKQNRHSNQLFMHMYYHYIFTIHAITAVTWR